MNILFKIAVCILCCIFFTLNSFCQRIITKLHDTGHLAFQTEGLLIKNKFCQPTTEPIISFAFGEALNVSFKNVQDKKKESRAILNFSSRNFIGSKIIAVPFNPSSPLLHDDSHVMSLLIHAGNVFPLILKFALYL